METELRGTPAHFATKSATALFAQLPEALADTDMRSVPSGIFFTLFFEEPGDTTALYSRNLHFPIQEVHDIARHFHLAGLHVFDRLAELLYEFSGFPGPFCRSPTRNPEAEGRRF